jgi:uncharacterized membrane protein
MGADRFSMGEAIKFGWENFKDNIIFFIVLLLVAGLIPALPLIIGVFVMGAIPAVGFILFLAGLLLIFVVHMGIIKVSLKFCDNTKAKLDDLLSSFDLLTKFIAGSILFSLIVSVGYVLFIIPGIYLTLRYFLFSYFIVDKQMGPIEALKASSEATEGTKLNLFLFFLLLSVISAVGSIIPIVGPFVTTPIIFLALAHVYRELIGSGGAQRVETADEPRKSPAKGSSGSPMYINLDG